MLLYFFYEFWYVGEDVRFEVCEPLASSNLEFVVRLDVLYEARVNLFNGVVQNVILKAESNSFISCLLLVVVVLDDLSCSCSVGCNVRLDLLQVSLSPARI